MSNLIKEGVDWFEQQRAAHVVESVKVIMDGWSKSVAATIIEPETTVNDQGVRIRTNLYTFLILSSSLQGRRIQRGIQIQWKGQTFEAVIGKSGTDFNDPYNQTIAIEAKLCS